MPTLLPSRPAPVRRLFWPDSARLLILVTRLHLLDLRMHIEVRRGHGFTDDRLLRLMRRWLALHEAIGAMPPGVPEPAHVREVWATLRPLAEIRRRAGSAAVEMGSAPSRLVPRS